VSRNRERYVYYRKTLVAKARFIYIINQGISG